jgi:uncharacterized protein (DUF302 family)
MIASHFTIDHIRLVTDKDFTDVTRCFEERLGRFDSTVFQSAPSDPEQTRSRIEATAGSSGFMLFSTTDHGRLLSLFGKEKKAVQDILGNPLIAMQMTRHNLAAGLYAPLRVLIYEDEAGATCLEYDLPSSIFGQFHDDRITSVAKTLDRKLENLVIAATTDYR